MQLKKNFTHSQKLVQKTYKPFIIDACSERSKLPEYNGLKDSALRGFFASKVRIKQLKKTGIISKEGAIRNHRQLQIIDSSQPLHSFTERDQNLEIFQKNPKSGKEFQRTTKFPPVGKRNLLLSHNNERDSEIWKKELQQHGQMTNEDFRTLIKAIKKKIEN